MKHRHTPIIVIGHYRRPSNKVALKAELRFVISSLKQKYPDSKLIITGDFNEPILSKMTQEADSLNVNLLVPPKQ